MKKEESYESKQAKYYLSAVIKMRDLWDGELIGLINWMNDKDLRPIEPERGVSSGYWTNGNDILCQNAKELLKTFRQQKQHGK